MHFLHLVSQANDHELYDHLTAACPSGEGVAHAIFIGQQAEQCLSQLVKYGLKTQHEAIEFLGGYYRSPMGCAASMSDYDVGIELLHEYIFCHLSSLQQKFHLLIQMVHKLYAFVMGPRKMPLPSSACDSGQCNSQCQADNPDSLATQEAMLPGFILMKVAHDLFGQYLRVIQSSILKQWRRSPEKTDLEVSSFRNRQP